VIVRIATEGQYELGGEALARLDEADNALLEAVEAGDEEAFRRELGRVLELVRQLGRRLGDGELRESDLILPPPDMTLAEARQLLSGYPRDLLDR